MIEPINIVPSRFLNRSQKRPVKIEYEKNYAKIEVIENEFLAALFGESPYSYRTIFNYYKDQFLNEIELMNFKHTFANKDYFDIVYKPLAQEPKEGYISIQKLIRK